MFHGAWKQVWSDSSVFIRDALAISQHAQMETNKNEQKQCNVTLFSFSKAILKHNL